MTTSIREAQYAFLLLADLETTGRSNKAKITQIASVLTLWRREGDCMRYVPIPEDQMDAYLRLFSYSTLVNPECAISKFIQELTRITPRMLECHPKFYMAAQEWCEEVNKQRSALCRVCGVDDDPALIPTVLAFHNGKSFDIRMLRNEMIMAIGRGLLEAGSWLCQYSIDTLRFFKRRSPLGLRKNSMAVLYEELFGGPIPDAHTALADTVALLKIVTHPRVLPAFERAFCDELFVPDFGIHTRVLTGTQGQLRGVRKKRKRTLPKLEPRKRRKHLVCADCCVTYSPHFEHQHTTCISSKNMSEPSITPQSPPFSGTPAQ